MDFTADIATTRTAAEATLIVDGILILLGLGDEQYATATRKDGSVTVVGLDDAADAVLVTNADRIWEISAKAGSAFRLETVKGFPTLTNRAG